MDNGDLTATATASGGTPPYMFTWSNGQNEPTASNLIDGETYTLQVMDATGCITESSITIESIVAIEAIENLAHFSLAPNPSTGIFNINLSLNTRQDIQIDLLNNTGPLLKTITKESSLGNNYAINLHHLSNGLYFLRFRIGNENFVEKIILNK